MTIVKKTLKVVKMVVKVFLSGTKINNSVFLKNVSIIVISVKSLILVISVHQNTA